LATRLDNVRNGAENGEELWLSVIASVLVDHHSYNVAPDSLAPCQSLLGTAMSLVLIAAQHWLSRCNTAALSPCVRLKDDARSRRHEFLLKLPAIMFLLYLPSKRARLRGGETFSSFRSR
jgi:hypothetical protein